MIMAYNSFSFHLPILIPIHMNFNCHGWFN